MFQLREEHLNAFAQAAYGAFEDGVLRQLREVFPDKVRAFTDEDIRGRIRAGIPRASVYGLTTQYQVMCFIDATYLLGVKFDSDPRYPSIRELLLSPLAPEDKADCLLVSAQDTSDAETPMGKNG
jgi:hypothetical protein